MSITRVKVLLTASAILIAAPILHGATLYEADTGSNHIYAFTPAAAQSTFASGLNEPVALAFDAAGNLYEADFGSGNIYKFTPAGAQSTFASGLEPRSLAFDALGNLYEADYGGGLTGLGHIYKFTPAGVQSTFASGLSTPEGLAFDSYGNLYEADLGSGKIYKFTPGGVQSTFASGFNEPFGLAFDAAGNLYEADFGSGHIYEFTPGGVQSTFASGLSEPFGLAFDAAGNLYESDYGSGHIYEFTPGGVQSTFASGLSGPADLAFFFVPLDCASQSAATGTLGASSPVPSIGCLIVGPNQSGKNASENLPTDGLFVNPGTNDGAGNPGGFQSGQLSVAWQVTDQGGGVYQYEYTFSNANTESISHIILALGGSLCISATTANNSGDCIYNLATDSVDTTGINQGAGPCATPYSCNASGSGTGFFDAANSNPTSADSGAGTSNPQLPAGFATTAFQLEPIFPASNTTGSFTLQFNSVAAPVWENIYIRDDQSQNNTTSVEAWNNSAASFFLPAPGPFVPPPSISKGFGATSIPLGASTTLSFTITNPNATPFTVNGVSFTDTLPTGLVVAAPNGFTGSMCGGSVIAVAGASSVSLSGGTITGGGSCTFSVNVTGIEAGSLNNSVTVFGGTNSAEMGNTATASLLIVAPPAITKVFGAATVPLNENTSLTFTINNNGNTSTALTGINFTDTLPSGLVVATPNGKSGTCDAGTITATAGSNTVSLTGASRNAGASCTFSVNVTATTAGMKNNSVTVMSANGGTGNTSMASVNVISPPSITKVFSPNKFVPGGTSTVSFTITNPNSSAGLTGVGFTDTLPPGMVVASPSGLTSNCSAGTATATAGSGIISLSGASIPGGGNCTVSATVTAPEGIYNNSVQVMSANGGTGNTAMATADVATPPSLSKVFGEASILPMSSTTLSFTLMNLNQSVTLDGLTFSDTLPARLVISTPSVVTGSCDGGTIVAPAGNNLITLGGASLAAQASCTFSVEVTSDGTVLGYVTNTTSTVTSTEALPGAAASAILFIGDPFLVTYKANLNIGESYIDITNTGTNGAPLLGPGFGTASGNICVNVYAFDPNEELVSCCSCLVTPDQTVNLGVNADLTAKTETGVVPTSVTVKVLSTLAGVGGSGSSCSNSAASVTGAMLANGVAAWGTTLHATPTAGSYATTETPFTAGTLSAGELASISGRCAAIIGNASGFGICTSCRNGALGGQKF